jgi:hypothetical protein
VKLQILAASAALLAPGSAEQPVPASIPTPALPDPAPAPVIRPAHLPGFAADLAQRPTLSMPSGWGGMAEAGAWAALARATGGVARQSARWDYARSLIAGTRGAEAQGVLAVMQQDDPDLAMVDSFRLARGVAYTLMGYRAEALEMLVGGGLTNNAEACAWRMRAMADAGLSAQALEEVPCAGRALAARAIAARPPFILAASRAAVEAGEPRKALDWLSRLPDRDPAANLYRGRAYIALGRPAEARLRLARTEQSGTMAERMDARLTGIEAGVASGALKPARALAQLDALRFVWRGDHIEERALQLAYRLASQSNDTRRALSAGAALFRFYDPAHQQAGFLVGLQARLAGVLEPANGLPLDQAAGLFWDYRDLAPTGAEGDLLVSRLGERLQAAGLYARAADLFEHQLFLRARDIAQGPLSVRVATLHILSGRPDKAVEALHRSAQDGYTDEMIQARERVEAVALSQLGKVQEAFAVLQDVPDSGALRAEILWKERDWAGLVAETGGDLPLVTRRGLSDVDQAVLLRHAIALAMLGREDALLDLHRRYAPAFGGLPTAPVFEMLTGSTGAVPPQAFAHAMASLPTASPAGDMAELLDAAPPIAGKAAPGRPAA